MNRIESCNFEAGAVPETNDKNRNEFIQDCQQLQAEVDRLKARIVWLECEAKVNADSNGGTE